MYGNAPGTPGSSIASQEPVELTPEQKTTVRGSMNDIRTRAEALLPFDYDVGTDVEQTSDGPSYTVGVIPPVGRAVSLQISIQELAEQTSDGMDVDTEKLDLDEDQCNAIAQQLVASTVLQVKQAEEEDDDTGFPAS